MATKLIGFEGGILIEAEVPENQAREISGNSVDMIQKSLDSIEPLLVKVCRPLCNVWAELNRDMQVDQAEVELGLSFTGEGNLYITKATAGANLTVKLVMKPLPAAEKPAGA